MRHISGRRWSIGGCSPVPTRASTATTIPRSATGTGRSERVGATLVVNAGSTSLKLRVVSGADDVEHIESLDAARAEDVSAVGHRVVHGGSDLVEPTVVDDAVRASIAELESIAPLHNAPALAGIDAATRMFPT